VVKKARQRLFNLRMLKKFVLSTRPSLLYRSSIESILLGCNTAWYCNSYTADRKALQRVTRAPERIGCTLPALEDTRCCRKSKKIIRDPSHPSHDLFSLLQSLRRGQYRSIMAKTGRLGNSFYPQTIRLLNSHN
jgi:hypothetical protein